MWYVLPQLRGLGSSSMATYYGIGSLDRASRCFLAAEPGNEVLREALRKYYAGIEDEKTLALLRVL